MKLLHFFNLATSSPLGMLAQSANLHYFKSLSTLRFQHSDLLYVLVIGGLVMPGLYLKQDHMVRP
jgi:hypothetical protein